MVPASDAQKAAGFAETPCTSERSTTSVVCVRSCLDLTQMSLRALRSGPHLPSSRPADLPTALTPPGGSRRERTRPIVVWPGPLRTIGVAGLFAVQCSSHIVAAQAHLPPPVYSKRGCRHFGGGVLTGAFASMLQE